MEIAAGWCLRVCSNKSSALFPAPRPSNRMRSGKSSATLIVLVPIEPVLPRRTTFFIASWPGQNMPEVEIHDRGVKKQAVEQVQYAANAGEKITGIFQARFAFE